MKLIPDESFISEHGVKYKVTPIIQVKNLEGHGSPITKESIVKGWMKPNDQFNNIKEALNLPLTTPVSITLFNIGYKHEHENCYKYCKMIYKEKTPMIVPCLKMWRYINIHGDSGVNKSIKDKPWYTIQPYTSPLKVNGVISKLFVNHEQTKLSLWLYVNSGIIQPIEETDEDREFKKLFLE